MAKLTMPILVAALLSLLWAGVRPVAGQDAFVRESRGAGLIERAYIDRGASHDPGTLVAMLHNRGRRPVKLDRLEVNGHLLNQWPKADNPVAWHRLTREELAPGQTALFTAKLVRPLSGMVRLTLHGGGETEQVLLSGEAVEPVRVVAVRCGTDGRHVNLFVYNAAHQTQRLEAIVLDDRKMPLSPGEDGVLPPQALSRIGLTLDRPLPVGHRLLLTLELTDRRVGVSARALPGFRLSIESGDQGMAERIAADPLVLESFQFERESTGARQERPGAIASLSERQGELWSMVRVSHGRFVAEQKSDLACVFACPTHATDSYQTAAYLGMRAQRQLEDGSAYQSFIHACRTQPLEGLAVFGTIADAVRFNGQLTTLVTSAARDRDEMPWTVYTLTDYAAQVVGPSIALPMIPLERDRSLFRGRAPLPVEARQMIYATLAGGAGGVAYRLMPQDWRDEQRDQMLDEVRHVNQEIRQVREVLAMGFPRALASVDRPSIQVACIDARPLGLLVLLINHDVRRSPPEMPPTASVQPHRGVTLTLDLPAGFEPGAVRSIVGERAEAMDAFTVSERQAVLTLDVTGATRMLWIQPR